MAAFPKEGTCGRRAPAAVGDVALTHSLTHSQAVIQCGRSIPLGVWAGGNAESNENLNNKMAGLASGTVQATQCAQGAPRRLFPQESPSFAASPRGKGWVLNSWWDLQTHNQNESPPVLCFNSCCSLRAAAAADSSPSADIIIPLQLGTCPRKAQVEADFWK